MSENFFDFVWKIENFAFCLLKSPLHSPKFIMDSSDKTEFYMGLKHETVNEKNVIGVYLYREDSDSGPDTNSLLFDISLLNYEGEVLKSQPGLKYDFQRNIGYGYGMQGFMQRDEVIFKNTNKYLSYGTLTILCRVRKFKGEEVKVAGRCIARTHIGVEHRAFNWDMDGILNLSTEVDKTITVDSVKNKYPSVTMKLIFNPELFSDGPLRLQIIQEDSARSNFLVCKISLINEQGDAVLSAKDEHFFEIIKGEQVWDFPLFIRKSHLIARKNSLLPSGILTLRCEFTMAVGPITEIIESLTYGRPSLRMINSSFDESCGVHRPDTLPKPMSSLNKDLENLRINKELCDVNLKIDGESFPAHKAILSSRSRVFKAMFTSDMKENATGSVCISDFEADTVKQMLSFIYTDSIDDLEVETALKLYFAADKYQLESLKELCSSYLGDHLEQSNVCEVLVLADDHEDHRLKGKVEEFIFFNESEILRSEKWKQLMKSHRVLTSETLYHLCLKKT